MVATENRHTPMESRTCGDHCSWRCCSTCSTCGVIMGLGWWASYALEDWTRWKVFVWIMHAQSFRSNDMIVSYLVEAKDIKYLQSCGIHIQNRWCWMLAVFHFWQQKKAQNMCVLTPHSAEAAFAESKKKNKPFQCSAKNSNRVPILKGPYTKIGPSPLDCSKRQYTTGYCRFWWCARWNDWNTSLKRSVSSKILWYCLFYSCSCWDGDE